MMRNPDTTNLSAIVAIAILFALIVALLYGADAEQAIRETELDKRLINSRIVFVQGGGK